MKKIFIALAIIIAIPLLLFIVAAVIFANIDLNNYKGNIAKIVHDQTGRTLTVNGQLKKSFFPWLGVGVEDVALSNAVGFGEHPFVAVKKIDVKIDTLSLFRLKPAIDKILLNGLSVQLAKNAQGKTNWDDLTAAKPTETPPLEKIPPATAPDSAASSAKPAKSQDSMISILAATSIGGVEIRNANVTWDDKQNNAHYAVQQLNLDVSEIALHKPLAVALSVDVESQTPPMKNHIELQSPRIEWDLEQQRYAVLPLTLKIKAQGDFLPTQPVQVMMASNISVDLSKQRLSVNLQQLQTMGISISGSAEVNQLLDAPAFTANVNLASFNPRDVLSGLKITLPPMADNNALTRLGMQTELKGDTQHLQVTSMQVKLDDTTIKTTAGLKNFSQPVITASVDIDKINVDHYLPPPGPSDKKKSTSDVSKPAGTGPEQPLPIPLELIRGLNLDAKLAIKQLIVMALDNTDVQMHVTAKQGRVDVKPVSLKVAGGSIETQATMNASQAIPTYQVRQTISNVDSNLFLQAIMKIDRVRGQLDLTADVNTQGLLVSDIKKHLNGTAKFRFGNGAVKGFNLGEIVREFVAKYNHKDYKSSNTPLNTDFAELTGSAVITNGIVSNKDLSAKNPHLRVTGEGSVDLPRNYMDYLVIIKAVESGEGQGGAVQDDTKGVPVPYRIKGNLDNLKYEPDYSLARKMIGEQVKKEVKKVVDKQVEVQKEEIKKKADEEKKKAQKKLEKALKKKLGL